VPLREFLNELKIELEDLETLKSIAKAAAEVQKHMSSPRNSAKASQKSLNTAIDKVVRTLDKTHRPATDTWEVIMNGEVPLSNAGREAVMQLRSRKGELISRVKEAMISPPLLNSHAGQQACSERCCDAVNAIIKKCKEEGTQFTDLEWDMNSKSSEVMFVDKAQPGWDCTVGEPAGFRRLGQIVRDNASSTTSALMGLFGGGGGAKKPKPKPVLFKGGACASDIIQGQIGTCFLLGAIGAVVANNENAIKKLFLKYDIDVGVYGIRFCVDGEWTYVIVDDWMPVDASGALLYASSKDPEEVWLPLLEKAYCKLHTCYEMCDGGTANEAIFSFFGGCSGKLHVKKNHIKDPSSYFKVLKQARQKGWLLTTTFDPKGAVAGSGKCGEAVLPSGLVGGHVYSLLKVVEAHGQQLVCCRNPWGNGEWQGRWSDRNDYGEWTQEMKEATGYKGAADGKFWMSMEDYVKNSTGAEFARSFGPNWKKLTHYRHFAKSRMIATVKRAYRAKSANELGLAVGDTVEVLDLTPAWWRGQLPGRPNKTGYFPADYVELNERPVARFDLMGTPDEKADGPMTVVVSMMMPNSYMRRRWFKRHEDGMNYKDTSYPYTKLCVIGPNGKVAASKEGKRRCLWAELKLPGGGRWKIYALALDGQGGQFSLRCYVKDGTATLKEVPGACITELGDTIGHREQNK